MTIKELRKSVNMTQSQFAEWLSTSIENIKNWERGKSQPSEMLLKLISYYVEGHKKGAKIKIYPNIEKLLKTIGKQIIEAVENAEENLKNSKYLQPYIFKKLKFQILADIEKNLTMIDIIEGIENIEKNFDIKE